jgi:hypothetical protein
MRKFSLVLMVVLAMGSMVARANGPVFEPLTVRGLGGQSGRMLNVFYVSGRESAIGARGQSLVVRSIKAQPIQLNIPASGEVSVPAIPALRGGFDVANYLVLAVTSSPSQRELFLRNPDGSIPKDPRLQDGDADSLSEADFHWVRLGYGALSKIRLDSAGRPLPAGTPAVVDFNSLNQ